MVYYHFVMCKETLESTCSERERLLEKLQGFDGSERMTTEDDVRSKREQVSQFETGCQFIIVLLFVCLFVCLFVFMNECR